MVLQWRACFKGNIHEFDPQERPEVIFKLKKVIEYTIQSMLGNRKKTL